MIETQRLKATKEISENPLYFSRRSNHLRSEPMHEVQLLTYLRLTGHKRIIFVPLCLCVSYLFFFGKHFESTLRASFIFKFFIKND